MELSICITVKDRSIVKTPYGDLTLFQNCINSIKESIDPKTTEVVIVDYNSTDYPLTDWVQESLGDIKCKMIQIDEKFSRGRGLNLAAENSTGKFLFMLDADMLISKDVVDLGLKYLNEGKVYFPVCFSYKDHTHKTGWWRQSGWGMVFVERTLWEKGKIPEYYKWGAEDSDFKDFVKDNSPFIREKCDGLYHQWHPVVDGSLTRGIQKSN